MEFYHQLFVGDGFHTFPCQLTADPGTGYKVLYPKEAQGICLSELQDSTEFISWDFKLLAALLMGVLSLM